MIETCGSRRKIKNILKDFIEVDDALITPDAALTADLGLNSFDVVNVVVAFEEEFNIEIPERDIRKLLTVGDVITYLDKLL